MISLLIQVSEILPLLSAHTYPLQRNFFFKLLLTSHTGRNKCETTVIASSVVMTPSELTSISLLLPGCWFSMRLNPPTTVLFCPLPILESAKNINYLRFVRHAHIFQSTHNCYTFRLKRILLFFSIYNNFLIIIPHFFQLLLNCLTNKFPWT